MTMKKLTKISAIAALSFLTVNNLSAQHKLVKKWESDSALKVPESILYDEGNQVLYASNIDGQPDAKDGKGSIGKVGLDGKIIATDWITGLNAPKGMALVKNMLWVADVDQVAVIDIQSQKIVKRIPIEGAQFLNDVAADGKGAVYVSDSKTKKVHKLDNGKPSVFLENLQGPNGLLAHDNNVYLLDNGVLYRVGKGKSLEKIADGLEGHTDGIENVEGNDFIVSGWEGVIYYVKGDGSKEKLLDTRGQKINSADIGYDRKNRIVYVPTFFRNTVAAYELK
jgi:hypothetical protein